MADMYCKKCNNLLSNDEKALGRCSKCGETFKSVFHEMKNENQANVSERPVGMCLKVLGWIVIIVGTILSMYLAGESIGMEWYAFLTSEISFLVSGVTLIGFSEMIKLMQEIKNKMK